MVAVGRLHPVRHVRHDEEPLTIPGRCRIGLPGWRGLELGQLAGEEIRGEVDLRLAAEVAGRHVVEVVAVAEVDDGVVMVPLVLAGAVHLPKQEVLLGDATERLELDARHLLGSHLVVLVVDLNVDPHLRVQFAPPFATSL